MSLWIYLLKKNIASTSCERKNNPITLKHTVTHHSIYIQSQSYADPEKAAHKIEIHETSV